MIQTQEEFNKVCYDLLDELDETNEKFITLISDKAKHYIQELAEYSRTLEHFDRAYAKFSKAHPAYKDYSAEDLVYQMVVKMAFEDPVEYRQLMPIFFTPMIDDMLRGE